MVGNLRAFCSFVLKYVRELHSSMAGYTGGLLAASH